mgnify:CR=1 FL=1|tara:strand:+ start:5936 stop:6751 length:816 start_codon:yes stop_codon:yes gene_type:complete
MDNEKVKIIAEIGWNFLGDMKLAEKMITDAKNSGAHIAKFQFWSPKTLKPGAWDSDGRREIYNKAALDNNKINKIRDICKNLSINCLFSVFTVAEAEILKSLSEDEIKIPSHEIANEPLIEYASRNFSYVYLSTGASTKEETLKAVDILKKGDANFNLMHCVSSYPCPNNMSNLPRLNWLKTLHNEIGLSDHSQSVVSASLAVAMGATVIEKHFTSDNNLEGRDNKFALAPESFSKMVDFINEASDLIIDKGLDFQESERDTVENYRGRWG